MIRYITHPSKMYRFLHIFLMLTFLGGSLAGLTDSEGTDPPNLSNCHSCVSTVYLTSATAGWALSSTFLNNVTYVLHEQQGVWDWEQMPITSNESIAAFAATSAGTWAIVSNYSPTAPAYRLLHYQQGAWLAHPLAQSFDDITDLVMLSPTDGWLIDDHGLSEQVVGDSTLMQFDGQAFHNVATPFNCSYTSLAFLTPAAGWAVGQNGCIAQYKDGRWRAVPSPTTEDLNSIVMVSPAVGWAVGNNGVTLRYNGTQWQVPSASQTVTASFTNLAMVSPTEGWATDAFPAYTSHLWHLQNGIWQKVSFSSLDRFVALNLSSPDTGWASGFVAQNASDPFIGQGFLAHFKHGTWHIAAIPRLPDPLWVQLLRWGAILFVLVVASLSLWMLILTFTPSVPILMRSWWVRIGFVGILIVVVGEIIWLTEPIIFRYYRPDVRVAAAIVGGCGLLIALSGIIAVLFKKDTTSLTPAARLAERADQPWPPY